MHEPLNVCFCCAREDQPFLSKLRKHLISLQDEGLITLWDETEIIPGAEWEQEIHSHFNSAHIVLLLVSADFLASKLHKNSEVRYAMERHAFELVHVIPIILRPVDWETSPLGKLTPLPTNATPVVSSRWTEDEAFLDIARGIRKAVSAFIRKVAQAEQARLREEESRRKAVQAKQTQMQKELALHSRSDERCEEGLIHWNKGEYVIQLVNSQPKLKRDLLGEPLPGPYRFRYLAQERILLSEEPIANAALVAPYLLVEPGATHEEQALQLHQKALCDCFQFSLNDLLCNQQGSLTDEQAQRAAKRVITENFLKTALIITTPMMIGLLFVLVGKTNQMPLWVSVLFLCFVVFYAFVVNVSLAVFVFNLSLKVPDIIWKYTKKPMQKMAADLSSRRLECREGKIKVVTREINRYSRNGGFTLYYYTIGEQLFQVPSEACDIIFSAIHYRIFSIRERSEIYPRLLSIEPLEVPRRG